MPKARSKSSLETGRISLERELANNTRQQFDVLAVDAFSGDGIPVHLLTREAFALYWEHLRPDGILAFHITNYHFDFSPVIRALAQEVDKEASVDQGCRGSATRELH